MSYLMLFAMVAVIWAPFTRPVNTDSSDAVARWLREHLQVTPDAEFYSAVAQALATVPRSSDEFVEAFLQVYEGADATRVRLTRAYGNSDDALRHFLGNRLVLVRAAVASLRDKSIADFQSLSVHAVSSARSSAPVVVLCRSVLAAAAIPGLAPLNPAVPNGP